MLATLVTINSQSEHTVVYINNLILQSPKSVKKNSSDIELITTMSDISVVSVATESELSTFSPELNNEKVKNRDSAFGNSYYYDSESEALRAKCGGRKKKKDSKVCGNACDEAYATACKELNCYKKLKKKARKLCKIFCKDEFY